MSNEKDKINTMTNKDYYNDVYMYGIKNIKYDEENIEPESDEEETMLFGNSLNNLFMT
ncbi:hypothetical protein [Clostridiisalibacter paucivorans]|uniref:hypothetical protein n=1 Tax=Clostridiisalibacter paucivorans TaxID=408753 RepID=UPI0012ECA222|nr:hypothetical protein [Clostridiisalibacter paucivorans]